MKNICLLICCLTLLFHDREAGAQVSAGKTKILYKGNDNEAVQDLKNCLSGFEEGTIIFDSMPVKDRTGQEFYLSSNGTATEIKYTTRNSLENAIYTYLDMLGFRWYGPGDNWFVQPRSLKRLVIKGKWFKPDFRNRSFFGTGGLDFGMVQPYDPGNKYKQKWYAWKRRNRINADFNPAGHAGEAFYLQNKSLLDAHPGWFLNDKGKVNGRIKIEQPGAVQAYKDWIRKIYEKLKSAFIALDVDPEDGRGGADDPLPAGMPGIKNFADKWWWLANEVAKDYDENNKRVVITMYAYGDGPYNALVPSFKLRKNVYPVIIPYAFQSAYLPQEMVKTWAKNINGSMGIYDYWNITQWSMGMPQFNIYSIVPKLNFWNNNKIDGIYLETTEAAGPMGHALWLAGQLQWDLKKNFEELYRQYLNDCFGKGAIYIKNMYDRWSRNYQGAAEVSFSLRDLKSASAAVIKNSSEWKRINELKAYVHFMKMYYEHDGTQKSKDAIFRYLYSIHHLMMVQTAAFVGQYYITPLDKGNIVPGGNDIKQATEEDIEAQFLKDIENAAPVYQIPGFVFDYNRVKYKEPVPDGAWRFGGFQCSFYFTAPFSGMMSFDAGAESNTPLKVFSNDSILIKDTVGQKNNDYTEKAGNREWKLKRFKMKITKGKTYFIQTSYGFSRIKINTPGVVLFKNPGQQDFDNYAYPVQYFYVPKADTEIVFFDTEPEGRNGRGYLIAPDGKVMKRESTGVKDIYRVPVAQPYRGKVWKANFGHPSWSFKNIPNITSLQDFDYNE